MSIRPKFVQAAYIAISGGGCVKKILYAIKVGLGIAMVLVASYSLGSFGGFVELIFGAGLMLAGVLLGIFLEKRRTRLFLFLSLISFVLTFSLYFLPFLSFFQYFVGGFLIYFACTMVLVRKKATAI